MNYVSLPTHLKILSISTHSLYFITPLQKLTDLVWVSFPKKFLLSLKTLSPSQILTKLRNNRFLDVNFPNGGKPVGLTRIAILQEKNPGNVICGWTGYHVQKYLLGLSLCYPSSSPASYRLGSFELANITTGWKHLCHHVSTVSTTSSFVST